MRPDRLLLFESFFLQMVEFSLNKWYNFVPKFVPIDYGYIQIFKFQLTTFSEII